MEENELNMVEEPKNIKIYNMVSLSNYCPYPNVPVNLDIGKVVSKKALREAKKNGENIFLAINIPDNKFNDYGVIASIGYISSNSNDNLNVKGMGLNRAKILNIVQREPFYIAEVEIMEDIVDNKQAIDILVENIKSQFEELCIINPKINRNILMAIKANNDPSIICDSIATVVLNDLDKKLKILNTIKLSERLELLLDYMVVEIQANELNKKISERVRGNMDKAQKEYFLRGQMRAIGEELGDDVNEIDSIEEKIKKLEVDEDIKEKLIRDVNRLRKVSPQSPDGSTLRNYLDTVVDLPWNEMTVDNLDLKRARQILDEDHAGLEKIKDRIIEYLAVMALTKKVNGQIICFAGPPGVGKTSVARSIARALDRKFVRMSLGGIKDEAEIRGHRKTYVGAMPGRIISNMRLAKVKNPLFLIDEIDKLGSDYKGDPSSAMLEVLDPEQNSTFRDNFLEVPFDLSQVLFIATANDISTIPAPLRDRMEIIELSSYTANEKLKIAKEHLIKRELEKHGLKSSQVNIPDETIMKVINEYTFEAGVRGLERQIATICRKSAVIILNEGVSKVKVKPSDLKSMLGAPRKNMELRREKPEIGVVSGLYYTPLGGGILNIEVNNYKGKGELKITGQLGEVMKESAQIAISVLKSLASDYDFDIEKIQASDIHIHVPEGAVKKDGPSAGIALTTALVSQFSNRKVDNNLAMTGEIGLRGEVLPIGGLKEKLFACVRSGITKAIVPLDNKDDVEELPKDITDNIDIHYVSDIREVLEIALLKGDL